MRSIKHFHPALYLLIAAFLLSACNTAPETSEPRFVATPVVGTPDFLKPTEQASAYPAPAESQADVYPAPGATADAQGYPGPGETAASTDGRSESALTSFKYAEKVAKEDFDAGAVLYAIQPSTIMLGNLGNPPVLPGWFYKFKVEGTRREYIVQIIDATVTGTTLAEAAMDTGLAELPIDVSQIKIDSTQVMEQFVKAAPENNWKTEGVIYDFELINLEGKGPVWSVVDPSTSQWLYSVSALNGNVVENPHQ